MKQKPYKNMDSYHNTECWTRHLPTGGMKSEVWVARHFIACLWSFLHFALKAKTKKASEFVLVAEQCCGSD